MLAQTNILLPSALIGGYFIPTTAVAMSQPGCPICEFVIREISSAIDVSGSTEDEVRAAVDAVCDDMPETVQVK